MRKFTFIFLLFLILIGKSNEVQSKNNPILAPLNVVPEWVKTKTTTIEHDILEELSAYYRINYSFLENCLTEERKEKIYSTANKLIEYAKRDGKRETDAPRIFAASPLERNFNSDFIEPRVLSFDVFTVDNDKAGLYLSVKYFYNHESEDVTAVEASVFETGLLRKFQGGNIVDYNRELKVIQGACSGMICYNHNGEIVDQMIQNLQYFIVP